MNCNTFFPATCEFINISGLRCEQEIFECESNPCVNAVRCVDEVGFYRFVFSLSDNSAKRKSFNRLFGFLSYYGSFTLPKTDSGMDSDSDSCLIQKKGLRILI